MVRSEIWGAKAGTKPAGLEGGGLTAITGLHEASDAARAEAHAIPVSELLARIAEDWPESRISLGDIMTALGQRGYGVLIVLFALPNLLPIYIPGLSPIFGIPLLIVCAQLAFGLPAPRLPAFLTRRSMKRSDLRLIAERAGPWIRRVERYVRPRPSLVTSRLGERLIGAYGVWLACIVIVPLPFTNGPPSLACLIMAIGLMEEDTLTILAGAVFGIFASFLGLSIIGTIAWALMAGFSWLIGGP